VVIRGDGLRSGVGVFEQSAMEFVGMSLDSNVSMILFKFALQFNHGIVSSSIHWDPERHLKPIHHFQVEIEGGKFLAMSKKRFEKSPPTVWMS